jgi:geranylgeranyl pyrophosphate synthase
VLAEIGDAFGRFAERRVCGSWQGPSHLLPAARYSLLAGGKRLRPALVVLSAYATTDRPPATGDQLLSIAAAVEMIHTYSLIHDDLPCMDNDDRRRGAPTCHVVHGVPDATWAGTALLVGAFGSLSRGFSGTSRIPVAARVLGASAGLVGMVGGQWLDTELPGSGAPRAAFSEVHERKTSALIAGCCALGGLASSADDTTLDILHDYGRSLGLAFQAVDDLLDVTGDAEVMGKRAGKDAAAGKLTALAALGLDGAKRYADEMAARASACVAPLGGPATPLLQELTAYLGRRGH